MEDRSIEAEMFFKGRKQNKGIGGAEMKRWQGIQDVFKGDWDKGH